MKPYNKLEKRQQQYMEKQAERKRRAAAKQRAEEDRKKEAERKDKERKLSSKIPRNNRSTKAADLLVQRVREREALEEKQRAREKARQAARKKKWKEAGEALRPTLEEFDRQRRNPVDDHERVSLKEKMRQNREKVEEKVRRTRPSLIDRLSVTSAKEKARIRVLHAVGDALKDVYSDEKGGGNKDAWAQEALSHNLLSKHEVNYLKEAPGNDLVGALDGIFHEEKSEDDYEADWLPGKENGG